MIQNPKFKLLFLWLSKMAEPSADATNQNEFDIVRRPNGQLLDYPVDIRWEVTRRNPYYMAYWEESQRYFDQPPGDTSDRRAFSFSAWLALTNIGVHGRPVPPSWPFEKLLENPDPQFLAGSLQPMTLRAIATMFLSGLDANTLVCIGHYFIAAAGIRRDGNAAMEERNKRMFRLFQKFQHLATPALDSVPEQPLFFMHTGASQTTILKDANRQAELWKARQGKTSPRIHTAKIPEQLKVWDAFEGWVEGRFDPRGEKTLKTIAKQLNRPRSTIHRNYTAAFEAIIGQPFSPTVWRKSIGLLKIRLSLTETFPSLQRRPASRSKQKVPVTQTQFGNARLMESKSAIGSNAELTELVQSIQSGFAEGLTDEAICRRLELKRFTAEMIAHIRKIDLRLEELGG